MISTNPFDSDPSTNPFDRNYVDPALNSTAAYGQSAVVYSPIASSPVSSPRAVANSPRDKSTIQSMGPLKVQPSTSALTKVANFFKVVGGLIAAYIFNRGMTIADACSGGCLWTLRGLLFAGKHKDPQLNLAQCMNIALEKKQYDVMALLQKAAGDVTYDQQSGMTFLHLALVGNQNDVAPCPELAAKLIAAGANVNSACFIDGKATTPLEIVCSANYPDATLIHALLNADAHITLTAVKSLMEKTPDLVPILIEKSNSLASMEDPNTGFTLLHVACSRNSKPIIEALLAKGAKIDATSKTGLTPIDLVTRNDELVQFLVEKGASITPHLLNEALTSDRKELVASLVSKFSQENISLKGSTRETLLHVASKHGRTDIIDALLVKGAKINAMTSARTGDCQTPLHMAKDEATALHLVQKGAANTVDKTKKTPLMLAVENKWMNVVKAIKDGIDIEGPNRKTALHTAMLTYPEAASVLIENGAKNLSDNDGVTPLKIAFLKNRDPAMIDRLIESGDNLDEVTVRCAIHAKNSGAALKLIQKNALDIPDPQAESRDESLLEKASKLGLTDVAKVLLEKDPKQEDIGSALNIALTNENLAMVRVLTPRVSPEELKNQFWRAINIVKNANIAAYLFTLKEEIAEELPKLPNTPLDNEFYNQIVSILTMAYGHKSEEFLAEAVKRDLRNIIKSSTDQSKLLAQDPVTGNTLMHLAAKHGRSNCMIALANKGVSLTTANKSGQTPLMIAIEAGATKLPIGLLRIKVNKIGVYTQRDLDQQDAMGHTALHIAALKGNFEAFEAIYNRRKELSNGNPSFILDGQARTFLHLAALGNTKGHHDIIAMMRRENSRAFSVKDSMGKTPEDYIISQNGESVLSAVSSTASYAASMVASTVSSTMEANKRHQAWVKENNVGAFGWSSN